MSPTMLGLGPADILLGSVVVAHDAGAAEHIAAWIEDLPVERRPIVVAAGPASRVLGRVVERIAGPGELGASLRRGSVLVSGTGWQSDVEHHARLMAKEVGLPTIAVLDHWVNYEERFLRAGQCVLPDELWVTDEFAFRLACETFASTRVVLQPNSFLASTVDRVGPRTEMAAEVLIIGEPIRCRWRSDGGEVDEVAETIVSVLQRLDVPRDATIRVRPHPAQDHRECISLGSRLGAGFAGLATDSLVEGLQRSRWVLGMESSALVIAAECDRVAVSCLPRSAHECRLPDARILHARRVLS